MSERLDRIEEMLLESNKRFDKMVIEDREREKARRKEEEARKKEEEKIREEERKQKEEERRQKEEERKEEAKERKREEKERKKEMKNMKKIMDGMGLTQGDISEEIIADNFGNVFSKIGENINTLERNLIIYTKGRNKRIVGEFDMIGSNKTKVFIGETKTKLTKTHIDKMINKTIPDFKKYDERHAGMKVYGVVGARVFANRWVIPYAIKHGLYVIKETHNGNAKILKESLVGVRSF